jgi:hypothetical protein
VVKTYPWASYDQIGAFKINKKQMKTFTEYVQGLWLKRELTTEQADEIIKAVEGEKEYTKETRSLAGNLAKNWVKNK